MNTIIAKKVQVLFLFLLLSGHASAQFYSLDSCKKLTLQNNIRLQNSELEIRSATQTKRAAFTKYFPSVSAMGSAFISDANFMDVDLSDVTLDISLSNSILNEILQSIIAEYGAIFDGVNINMQMIDRGLVGGITATQPIFAGGRIVTGNQLAKLGVEASEYKAAITRKEVLQTTEESYWLVISLQEKKKTIDIIDRLLTNLEKDVSGAFAQGVVNKSDLLKVRLKQHELNAQRLKLNNGIKLAGMALCQHIGIDYSPELVLTDSLVLEEEPWIYKTAHENALSQRPESHLLDLNVRASTLQKRMVIGEALPEIAVGAGYLYNNIMGKNKTNGMLFATVRVPVTGWWEAAHQIKKMQIENLIAENNRRDMNEKMMMQFQQLWNDVEEAYFQVKSVRVAVEEALENYRFSNDYYMAGMISLSELLEAQGLLQQARNQYSDQLISYQIKLRNYCSLTGQE